MNRIDKLIEQLCPEGVEWKELGEVSKILNGYSFKSNKYVDSGIRVIRISDVQKGKISDKDLKFYDIDFEDEIKNFILKENDLVMSLTGNVGRVAMLSKQHLPAGLNQRVTCIRPNNNHVLVRFLFHYFNQNSFENEAMNNSTGGGQKNLSTTWLNKYKIPIPALPVQQEIVTILDKFTALDASLQAELEARRKQYEHYRNQLLNFEGKEVEWKMLGEICKFVRGPFGGAIKKDCFVASGYAIYEQQHAINGNTDIRYFISDNKFNELKRFEVFPGDLIMSCSGTMGKIAIIPENAPKGVINQALLKLTVKNEISAKYLKYYFENTITQQMNDEARGGAI